MVATMTVAGKPIASLRSSGRTRTIVGSVMANQITNLKVFGHVDELSCRLTSAPKLAVQES